MCVTVIRDAAAAKYRYLLEAVKYVDLPEIVSS